MIDRTVLLLAALFLAAITAANLITTEVGPQASVYTALGLVALDLVTRDAIHDRLPRLHRAAFMTLLILAGSAISYLINHDAHRIAIASAIAFAAALTIDAIVYQAAQWRSWLERSNLSNIAAAIVDSAVFVAIAFPGGFLWNIAIGQATAKIAGGVIFALAWVALHNRRRPGWSS